MKSLGYNVLLTRSSDRTVLLDERSAHSNKNRADVFVSVHANAAPNQYAQGIETFYYPHSRGKTLFTSYQNAYKNSHNYFQQKEEQSKQLATIIQQELCMHVAPLHKYKNKIDRSVKYAPLQVLVGTVAPSVLVEVGFISNPYEKELLEMPEYQQSVVRGIASGIKQFLQKIS